MPLRDKSEILWFVFYVKTATLGVHMNSTYFIFLRRLGKKAPTSVVNCLKYLMMLNISTEFLAIFF